MKKKSFWQNVFKIFCLKGILVGLNFGHPPQETKFSKVKKRFITSWNGSAKKLWNIGNQEIYL